MRDESIGPWTGPERQAAARNLRIAMAEANSASRPAAHGVNGDDGRYPDYRGSFTKGLAHDPKTGLVAEPADYEALKTALSSGELQHYETIPLANHASGRKLVNPQAALGFEVAGADSHSFSIPPPPAFNSREEAAEIVENYWMAMLRDTHFDEYATSKGAKDASDALSGYDTDFKGPKNAAGKVVPGNLFRGLTYGDQVGPYLSQFLMLPVPFGAQGYDQRMLTPKKGLDFGQTWRDYIAIQNGDNLSFQTTDFEDAPVYIRNGRDLGQWVHIDVLFQAYFNAMLILLQGPGQPTPLLRATAAADAAPYESGMGASRSPFNAYAGSRTQAAFGTLGDPWLAATMCEVSSRALRAVWFQKWQVHRRLRPEAFASRIHATLNNLAKFDIDKSLSAKSKTLQAVAQFNKGANKPGDTSYLLPLAFPEGSPIHPAYGAGHATVAGACVTVLKAYFDGQMVIDSPKQVSRDGSRLEPCTLPNGTVLTVEGELNKLASNIAIGRNIAGVHWRSDGTESLKLGEQVAIHLLREQRQTFNEASGGFSFRAFDGHLVVI
jgi:hypothetical protein